MKSIISLFAGLILAGSPDVPIKVAVIDTGYAGNYNISMCKNGHRNFTKDVDADVIGHGTNVSFLIQKFAKNFKYCQIIVKFYDRNTNNNLIALKMSLMYVLNQKDIKYINISGGGKHPDPEERKLIEALLDENRIIVVAAGNHNTDLDKECNFYPACYDERIIVVGNGNQKDRHYRSNYGSIVDVYIDGTNKGPKDLKLTGTSQSAAIYTGILINKRMSEK